ncbi:MAG: glutathione synthase, partial [Serpentinimonas sp.]|nr:glutathione synthase [Serpentinimonas sp.]
MSAAAQRLLFVADPLPGFKIQKDSSFAMLRECQRRGHALAVCTAADLHWRSGAPVQARVQTIELTGHATDWYRVCATADVALRD